jgi:peptide/nickel transport system permease protein
MGAFIVRRLIVNAGVFLLITVGIFALVHAAPGDPVRMMINPEQAAGGGAAFIARQRHLLGLDQSLPIQYWNWLVNAVHGQLGYSYLQGRPVTAVIGERVGPTVELMGLAVVVSLAVGIPLGIIAAVRRNTVADYGATVFSLGAISIPPFFLGITAIYLFSLKWNLLPSSGMSTPGTSSVGDLARHLVLPVLILGLAAAGPITRFTRSGLIGELAEDYVRTAEAKGASRARVVLRHGFRNSLLPLITVIAMSIPTLLAGAVVIEQVFAWPGMGQLAISSITQNDYPVVIGFSLYIAALVLFCNLAADVLYAVADPRVNLR